VLRSGLDTRQLIVRGVARVRAGWWPVALASAAAALAWLIAHRLLGHPQPFFAPIAAAISLSTSQIQRSRRIAQMVVGVLLGIGIGELLVAAIGTSTVTLGLIVFVTMSAALLSGEGFFGEGMMFANQAAASAILVVTLHRAGTGSERAVDAVIGGAVALVVGVILFPAQPLSLLRDAERAVLRALASLLESVTDFTRNGEAPPPGWVMRKGHEVHALLAAMARARATARVNVRVAPRRWRLRAAVDAEVERTAQLDLLANAVLSLVRAATAVDYRGEQPPEALEPEIAELASAISRLASEPRPWSSTVVKDVLDQVGRAGEDAAAHGLERNPVIASIVRAVATDVEDLVGGVDRHAGRPPGVAAHQL
jgi:uncharacterized membrane protein YgaE (UPF0421/DUF939 family)